MLRSRVAAVIAVVAVCIVVVAVPPSGAATYGVTVAGGNGFGSAADQLNSPYGVAVDGSGNVYVADQNNNRVQLWAPGATEGVTVAGGNGLGSAANQLRFPRGVAVDGSGNVYVTDTFNVRVQLWAPGATEGVTVAGGNGTGSAANQLNLPSSVAVDGSGNVYVTDTENDRVQLWAPGATEGVTVAGGNGAGSAADQLNNPVGVAVDGSGNVYVTDTLNVRVQLWAPGATEGVTVAGGNGAGSAADQLNNPVGVAVDGSGNVYVGDTTNHRVQLWAPGATEGVTVAGGNGAGSAADQLNNPYGVAVDGSGNVYVGDHSNHRVQLWFNGLADQSIDFAQLADHVLGASPFVISAAASSGLAVSFGSDTPTVCIVSVATVSLVTVGTCTIRASQAGDGTWAPAPEVTQSFQVTPPVVSVGSASVVEGDAGKARSVQFAVTLSEPATTITKVGYRVQVSGSAEAPYDVAVRSGYVTFKPSAKLGLSPTSLAVTAKVAPDLLVEGDETFSVTLTGVTGTGASGADYVLGGSASGVAGSASAVGTIVDDDPASGLTVSVGDASIWEGHIGQKATSTNNARVWVNLSEPAATTVSVKVTVAGDTATPGSDFKKNYTKTLTFKPGQYQRAVAVPVFPDVDVEGDETVTVTLSDPTGGLLLGRAAGTVTILNDD